MAERTAPDDQELSFRLGVRIMITGMRAVLDERAGDIQVQPVSAECHEGASHRPTGPLSVR